MTRSEIELEALRSVLRLATHIEQAHGSSLHNPGDMLDELAGAAPNEGRPRWATGCMLAVPKTEEHVNNGTVLLHRQSG